MSTLRASEKTNQGMLPQSLALESTSADKPGVGTKRDVEMAAQVALAGVQHGRGEIGNGCNYPSQRHCSKTDSSVGEHDRGLAAPFITSSRVFVLDKDGRPLQPCHPARARKLLVQGRAVVARQVPFVIRLRDRTIADSEVNGVELGISPGSKVTGLAVLRVTGDGIRVGLVSIEIHHRGPLIHKKLQQRANYRRGRRSRNLRYRAPRFLNRTKPKGWLAPSLRHRVDTTMSMVERLRRWAPVTAVDQELVRFDMQKMQNPEIAGVEYQRGELFGYEVREYLLAKWGRTCAYCGATDTPLNIDHIHPRSKGGSDRVSNLALACVPCNQEKNNRAVEDWLIAKYGTAKATAIIKKVLAQAKAPLMDVAAVNSTRWALWKALGDLDITVSTGSGARTKWNRSRFGVPKTHSLDALCVGSVNGVRSYPEQVIVAHATGRGSYSRTRPDAYGFPRLRLTRNKRHYGFATGDLVRAVVPRGKNAGTHIGRVAIRSRGSFNITTAGGTAQGVSHKYCTIIQRSDGWGWTIQPEGAQHAS